MMRAELTPHNKIHPNALVDEGATIGKGTRVWAFAHILSGAVVGQDCNICDHTFIEGKVRPGDRVTVKCGVNIWDGGDGRERGHRFVAYRGPQFVRVCGCAHAWKRRNPAPASKPGSRNPVRERHSISNNVTLIANERIVIGNSCLIGDQVAISMRSICLHVIVAQAQPSRLKLGTTFGLTAV